MDFWIGQQIEERFLLLACLGQGGQGAVWKAQDLLPPGRLVALKRIGPSPGGTVHFERARREAQHLAALDHPGLVRCYRLIERPAQGDLILVMELAEGQSLDGLLDDPRLSARHKLEILRNSARALAALHEAGIVHRDLKPENIVVSERFWQDPSAPDSLKLIDLGISVEIGNPVPLTQPNHVIGTTPYMAPEIIAPSIFGGSGATPTADVFAWGILAWKLLLGTHPTNLPESASLAEFIAAYLDARHRPAWMPSTLTPAIGALLRDCVRLSPSARIQDGAQILQRLYSDAPSKAPARTDEAPPPSSPPARSIPLRSPPAPPLPTETKDAPRSRPSGSSLAITAPSLIPPPPQSRAKPRDQPRTSRWLWLPLLSLFSRSSRCFAW